MDKHRSRKKFVKDGVVGTLATIPDNSVREEEVDLMASISINEEDNPNPLRRLPSDNVALKTRGNPLKIGTWNVRTLYKAGKLENAMQEMKRMELDIMGTAETRWTESGKVVKNNYTMIYSGGNEHKYGVGILMKNTITNAMMGYWAISERMMMMKLLSKPFNINIIEVYAPTQDHDDDEIEKFYDDIKKQ